MPNQPDNSKKLFIVAAIIITFSSLAVLVVFLARAGIITIAMALLLLIGLVGVYFGLGILIGVHLMLRNLE